MYSQMLRNVLRISTKLSREKLLKCNSLIFPTVTTAIQNLLTSHHCCIKYYSTKVLQPLKDPLERKKAIDEKAQQEIDALIAEKPETTKLMQILELEHDVWKQEGERVPSKLRPRDWIEILKLPNRSQRRKFYNYLFIIEKKSENRKQLQEENRKLLEYARLKRQEETDSDEMKYGFGYNFLLRRISETTMNQLWNWNMMKAIMYGNKLVFDCSYEKYMNNIEVKSTAKQILESYAYNRQHNFPFEFFLCNVDYSGKLLDILIRYLPNLLTDDCPINVTPQSYLEIFEKVKLVYLTSTSQHQLEKYDPNMVYIIGAFVDKGNSLPISFGKAKEEGLQTAKLPLDKYSRFGDGSGKNLTVNQVSNILLDAQLGDWVYAIRHIPVRKLYESRIRAMEKKLKRESNEINSGKIFDINENRRFESIEVSDFSNSARVKLRKQWNK